MGANDPSEELRYDRTSIIMHWTTAVLVILLWTVAHFIDDFPKGPERIAMRSVHITLGVILLAVVLARIGWRSGAGRRLPMASSGWAGYLAKAMHFLLYLLLAAVLLLGIGTVWTRGDSYFGLFSIPKFDPNNTELRKTFEEVHETAANILLILAGLHALAALAHHFVLRNGVLRRMLPRGSLK